MRLGTRSLLYGAHCFFLHPWFVAWAWWRLYGFPWDPRLWVAFAVHDVGYWGKHDMDGQGPGGGEEHPIAGALLMARWFGPEWGEFCLLHSRFFARRLGKPPSRLCVADKLAMCLTPTWLFLAMTRATGELWEYVSDTKYGDRPRDTPRVWMAACKAAMREWVDLNKDPDRTINAFAVEEPAMAKLPGYLDGGYDPGRYVVAKSSGEAVDPRARYLVLRYDQDPHAVVASLAYAVSVLAVNPALHDGILDAVRVELNLSPGAFREAYGRTLSLLQGALRPEGQPTLAGDLFREAMLAADRDPETGEALDFDGKPYPSDMRP